MLIEDEGEGGIRKALKEGERHIEHDDALPDLIGPRHKSGVHIDDRLLRHDQQIGRVHEEVVHKEAAHRHGEHADQRAGGARA